jgi:hypothetical protein
MFKQSMNQFVHEKSLIILTGFDIDAISDREGRVCATTELLKEWTSLSGDTEAVATEFFRKDRVLALIATEMSSEAVAKRLAWFIMCEVIEFLSQSFVAHDAASKGPGGYKGSVPGYGVPRAETSSLPAELTDAMKTLSTTTTIETAAEFIAFYAGQPLMRPPARVHERLLLS